MKVGHEHINPRYVAYKAVNGEPKNNVDVHSWLQTQTDVWRKECNIKCNWCGQITHGDGKTQWCEHPFPSDVKQWWFDDWLLMKYVDKFDIPQLGDNCYNIKTGESIGKVIRIEDTIVFTDKMIPYVQDKKTLYENQCFIFVFKDKWKDGGKLVKNELVNWSRNVS